MQYTFFGYDGWLTLVSHRYNKPLADEPALKHNPPWLFGFLGIPNGLSNAIIVILMPYVLRRQGVALGFGFLNDAAGFDIGQKLIEFTSSDSFARALLVEPNNVSHRIALAELYKALGLRRRAQGELQRALISDPNSDVARQLLASLKN